AFRSRRERRSVLVAIASTLAFAIIVWATLISTPGWAIVQAAFFDPEVALRSLPRVWDGFLLNLQVLGMSVITVGVCALFLATLRPPPGAVFFPLRVLAAAYTGRFRGPPFIIVLQLFGFGRATLTGERAPATSRGSSR